MSACLPYIKAIAFQCVLHPKTQHGITTQVHNVIKKNKLLLLLFCHLCGRFVLVTALHHNQHKKVIFRNYIGDRSFKEEGYDGFFTGRYCPFKGLGPLLTRKWLKSVKSVIGEEGFLLEPCVATQVPTGPWFTHRALSLCKVHMFFLYSRMFLWGLLPLHTCRIGDKLVKRPKDEYLRN